MTVDVCPSESGSPWDPGDSVDQEPEQVFVFGPRDDMSEVVAADQPPPPDDYHGGSRLSPILVAPARNHFDIIVTAPTPATAPTNRWSLNETPLGSTVTRGSDSAMHTPIANGTLRRAQSDRPQYLSPPRNPRTKPRYKTIPGVTEEARKVLDQLIKLSDAEAFHGLAATAAASNSQLFCKSESASKSTTPEIYQQLSPIVVEDGPTNDDHHDEPDGNNVDDHHQPIHVDEPDHFSSAVVDSPQEAIAMPDDDATSHSAVSGPNSLYSFSSRSSSNRNRIHQLTHVTDETQLIKAAEQEQQRKRKKKKRKTQNHAPRRGSSSSSSDSEYEIVDGQLQLRRRKSIFKRAKDRLRQSFRHKKQPRKVASFDPYRIDDDEIREAEAQTISPAAHDTNSSTAAVPPKRHFRFSFLSQRSETKSRSSAERSSSAGAADGARFIIDEPQSGLKRCLLHDPPTQHTVAENGLISLPPDASSAAPPVSQKEKNRGIFNNLLRSIRKSGGKLRRKGSKKESTGLPTRSRSADAISHHATNTVLRPPTGRSAAIVGSRLRKAASHDETTLHGVFQCTCAIPVPMLRPRPPPLPELVQTNNTTANYDPSEYRANGSISLQLGGRRSVAVPAVEAHGTSYDDHMTAILAAVDVEVVQTTDEVDSKSPEMVHTPFDKKTEAEKEDLYERIAEQLAMIADNYNMESPRASKNTDLFKAPQRQWQTTTIPKSVSAPIQVSVPLPPSDVAPPTSTTTVTPATAPAASSGCGEDDVESGACGGGRTPIEQKIGRLLRKKGDHISVYFNEFQPAIEELVRNASYSHFQQVIHKNVGSEPGWQELALIFNLTNSAVHLAGMGTAAALKVKELTLRYFEDRFAGWIIGQGGWESVVEETDLSSEVD